MTKRIAIFGGGMTGLVAGRELVRAGHDVNVYEAADHLGGLASTFRDSHGFIYDNGPRFIFSTLAEKLGIADICEPVKYFEHLFVGGRYYLFPFGFILNLRYCLSVGSATLTRSFRKTPKTLGEYLTTYYGTTFSKEVLMPLIEKWSGLPAGEMSIDFASRLLPTNISYLIYQIIRKIRGGITEDYWRKGRYIVYPKGSNSKIFEALASAPGLNVHLSSPIEQIHVAGGRVKTAVIGGKSIEADYYLSTIPISRMVTLIDNPGSLSKWTAFKYRGVMILFLKINRPKVLQGLWTWFPEPQFRFYRISEFKNALPDLAPQDKTLIAIEFACNEDDPFWGESAESIYGAIEKDLEKLYGLSRSEIFGFDLRLSPHAYPVLAKATEVEQRALLHRTPLKNLFIAGRTGMFQYRMLEGCYESAVECAAEIVSSIRGARPVMKPTVEVDRFGRPDLVPE